MKQEQIDYNSLVNKLSKKALDINGYVKGSEAGL
jgi:hypothetical protein